MNLTEILDYVNQQNAQKENYQSLINISILRNFTIEGIEPFLKYHHYKSGIDCNIRFGNFDNVTQDLLSLSSVSKQPDILILSLILESFPKFENSSYVSHEEIIDEVKSVFNLALSNSKSLINVNTFIPPFYSDAGISFTHDKKDVINEIEKANSFIRDFVIEHNNRLYLSDWERLIRITGIEGMDSRFWFMSKAPFKNSLLNLYAKEITKISRALKGKNKKCLVLDCDNTLWGGIIGEEGLSKIKLDNNSYPGKVFFDFQKNIIKLYDRGILVCICSKNNEDDVWEVLEKHPHSLIKKEHIIAHRINWNNKATGLTEIAEELNIGLDSFVFVDDSETEIKLVNDMLPEVTTLMVPKQLFTYPQILFEDGLFDGLHQTSEDKKRTMMYQTEKKRKENVKKFEKIEDFLKSLELKVNIHEATADEIPRVAQLTQKTNQFNLTTKRYSETQIEGFAKDETKKLYTLKVLDRFGDFGLTGVMIIFYNGKSVYIDSLLLSCRILGRNIENVFLDYCLRDVISKWNPETVTSEYIPTKKNIQTLNFWESAGFKVTEQQESFKKYSLNTKEYSQKNISYIKINPS